jgi:hypothetical protein
MLWRAFATLIPTAFAPYFVNKKLL